MTAARPPVPPSPPSLRTEHSEATRRALIERGCDAFSAEGYQAAGIEAVARAARVSRGALYHHFRDKKALFEAVVVLLQEQAAEEVSARMEKVRDPWSQLVSGSEAYLDVCKRPVFRRVVLEDAPAVLGKERCAEIADAHAMAPIKRKLASLQASGRLAPVSASVIGALLGAMIAESAALLSASAQTDATPERVQVVLRTFLEAFRAG